MFLNLNDLLFRDLNSGELQIDINEQRTMGNCMQAKLRD
jgi:hypothetical protein